MSDKSYRICTRTVMDTTDPDITFDEKGISNHYYRCLELMSRFPKSPEERTIKRKELVQQIREQGRGRKYDCIIGVSGGVDSTYVAWVVKEQLGLKPLAVHLDNGWNSELAVKNIELSLKSLGIDLFTYVIDWQEFRDLQLSFLKASTPDSEIPTDHAINAILYKIAAKYGVRYILNGVNLTSESIMPVKWGYGYYDFRYIRDVQNRFGSVRLKTFPYIRLSKLFYYMVVKKIRVIPILNYVEYDREQAMNLIREKLGWVYYGGKHYESIYTRFFQAYILPLKFSIDKRKAHYSSLICAGQMTRDQALELLTQPVAPEDLLKEDREYVIKKFEIAEEEFERIMSLPPKTFTEYRTNYHTLEKVKKILRKIKG